ncbi:MAG: hypothetical protein AAB467_02795 [Patescibacteria group bacterium]
MIAAVVPVKRGSLALPFFDYLVPESLIAKIKIGQLVEIPLRSKNELGIVRSLSNASDFKNLKSIGKIINELPFLSDDCLKFLEETSDLYHSSLGSIFKSALPPIQKRKLSNLVNQPEKEITEKKIFAKPKLFTYKTLAEKNDYLVKSISKVGQTLIIVPEAADADHLVPLMANLESTCVVTGYLSDKNLFDIWMKIWQGDVSVIIGTRRALLMSFHNLQTIIITEAWHPSHKSWDAAPRIHSRDAALIAAKHYGSELHIIGHTPAVDDYFFGLHQVYESAADSLLPKALALNVIDLRHETRSKNFSPISHALEEALLEAKAGSIFLYCNRRGSASYVMCSDCSNVLRCKNCRRAQTFHENTAKLTCHYCKNAEPMLSNCSKCDGVNMRYFGKGTESVIKELKKLLPNDPREIINLEDSESTLKKLSPEHQIIVGTQLAWPHLDWRKLSLMAFIDADTPLFVPEFRSTEHAWDMIHDAEFRMDGNGAIFIQTSHPEHPVYTNLGNSAAFYAAELEQRKIFGYPPFKYLLKLFYGSSVNEPESRESDVFTRKLAELTKGSIDIKITPSLELFPAFQRGKYWRAIIIKLSYRNYKQQLRRIMKIVPESWKVDPNPNTLLGL